MSPDTVDPALYSYSISMSVCLGHTNRCRSFKVIQTNFLLLRSQVLHAETHNVVVCMYILILQFLLNHGINYDKQECQMAQVS